MTSLQDRLTAASEHFGTGNFQDAYDEYVLALAEVDAADTVNSAAVHTNMGACLLNLGKPEEALEEYNTALEQDPSNLNAMHNKGVAQKQMGDVEGALASFQGVIEQDPGFKQSYRGVIEALMTQEDYEGALGWVEKAIAQDDEDTTLYTDKANILLKLGRAEESLEYYEYVIQSGAATEQVQQLYSIALSQTAVSKDQAGDLAAAETFYDKAIELEATETRLFNRAYLYMRTERMDQAIEGFRAVVALNAGNTKAQAVLGTLLLQEERYGDALEPLKAASAASEGEDFTDVTYNLGFALLKQEQYTEAAAAFQSVLDVDGENKNAQNGLRAAQHAAARAERRAAAAAQATAASAPAAAAAGDDEDEDDEAADMVMDLPRPKVHSIVQLQSRGLVKKQIKRLSMVPGSAGARGAGGIGAFASVPEDAPAPVPAPAPAAQVQSFYSADRLRQKPLPEDVDATCKEMWLSDEEFMGVFGIDKDTFNSLPKWKRINARKNVDMW